MTLPISREILEAAATARELVRDAHRAWKPPPKLSLSEWADEHFYLSAESSAQTGRWKTLPYQRGIMDAFTDPRVTHVSVIKSARVGWTKIVNALVGYSMHQDPCPILVVQPTIDDAKGYSKEEIAPMLRDCPALAKIVYEDTEEKTRDSNTILHKRFPGGVLSLVGANSGAGLRRVSRKRVLLDEVDAYPLSAGDDGDPVRLASKRTEFYVDRKIGAGSTPLLAGASRIEQMFLAGDQRRYFVPCHHCGHFDHLVFTERPGGGHFMQFDPDDPDGAHFVCSKNGCVIEHHHKRQMVERGEWRASKPFAGHASFHIWAAYSYSPNASWAQLAKEFLEAKRSGPEQLKTFVNTALGETWQERGEAPDWERLYQRRERYEIGTVPDGVKFLTAGVDVQKDRFVYEVVGWGLNRESWSIDAGVLPGDTSNESAWLVLDELLDRRFPGSGDRLFTIRMMALDSGYNTQRVYAWGRRHERNRVMAIKGVSGRDGSRTLLGSPTAVDVNLNGKRITRGYKVWPVGSDVGKGELYGYLRQPVPTDGKPFPVGFCHFPELGEDYFKQICSEHLVKVAKKTGHTVHEWQVIPGRENHYLDARIYARAAASALGIDRIRQPREAPAPKPAPAAPHFEAFRPPSEPKQRPISDFRLRRRSGKGWLR